jgi:hypothetical protein
VKTSAFQAYEIFGPGVGVTLSVSTVATVMAFVAIAVLVGRAYRNAHPSVVAIGLLLLTMAALEVVTNKTFSPQYVLWLGGAMAVLLSIAAARAVNARGVVRRLGLHLLALAALTQLIFPILYTSLLGRHGPAYLVVATAVLTVRNVLLAWFCMAVWLATWRALDRRRQAQGGPDAS